MKILCSCHISVHHHVVAEASAHHKQMENFMCSELFMLRIKSHLAFALLLLLSAKRHAATACALAYAPDGYKRAHDGFVPLPPFCGLREFDPHQRNTKNIFFMWLRYQKTA